MALRLLAAVFSIVFLAGGPALQAQEAEVRNDLRDFRIGMTVADLPTQGYGEFACAADGRAVADWADYATCAADDTGLRELRFEYTATRVEFVKANDKWEGTRVFGHPAVVSLLIDEAGVVEGIRILTDPKSRRYMRKKAFLLGERAKYRFSPETWSCVTLEAAPDETPVGGIYIKERCENKLSNRHIKLEIDLYRRADQGPEDFVNRTRIEILRAG